MASNQIILVLFCGEIWRSLSTEIPPNVSVTEGKAYASTRSPMEDKVPKHQSQATVPSLHTPQIFKTPTEATDGSWIAALLIGTILISMIIAIIVILLWKCCKKPRLVDTNWAGRSPFADGDMLDVFGESDQASKRSSILSMLPWKFRQDAHLQGDSCAPEKPPGCTTDNAGGQLPPAGEDCSVAAVTSISVSSMDASPPPSSEGASCACDPRPHPAPAPESPDLPPPPDWLGEPPESPGLGLSEYQESHSETQEQFPPPPELAAQEDDEAQPQPPPPEHPL
ncbi:protein EVI2B [Apteryx rowi]|uniref:protein EVI2B n=1 Tax=Apteryx rowi TaxID=308060 RepID=UPI000E1DFF03|nr:protein EVI2B [Apteryx rowi]XP_025926032.1 protein EVI2B [Apteryx rowi]XP_025926033.1 protein EVI2B [Apteryx rowi]XP_025926034.1 protein EVI2B [Apteryx rowi]XP_025926035.1 protein EVI2B [Apteryx rowi]XP_025926036.1 protein EVI2B [Apteryx rowi]XP_025926037.1 protein EVI2B [Apteryx rowi]